MLPSNCPVKYAACASVTTLRTPSLRQSPAGKLRLSATQISIFSPTARSVKSWKPGAPVRMLITGHCFFVPKGGLGTAAAATRARGPLVSGAATGLSVSGELTLTLPT